MMDDQQFGRLHVDLDTSMVFTCAGAPADQTLWCLHCGQPVGADGQPFTVGPGNDALHDACDKSTA